MTGKHGTLWQYLKAHQQYGGRPPDPTRDRYGVRFRSRRVWIPSAVLGMTLAMIPTAVLAFALPTATLGRLPVQFALVAAWLGVDYLLLVTVLRPVMDWIEDVPRAGLPQIDAAHNSGVTADV